MALQGELSCEHITTMGACQILLLQIFFLRTDVAREVQKWTPPKMKFELTYGNINYKVQEPQAVIKMTREDDLFPEFLLQGKCELQLKGPSHQTLVRWSL
jgi:hypothetical protein